MDHAVVTAASLCEGIFEGAKQKKSPITKTVANIVLHIVKNWVIQTKAQLLRDETSFYPVGCPAWESFPPHKHMWELLADICFWLNKKNISSTASKPLFHRILKRRRKKKNVQFSKAKCLHHHYWRSGLRVRLVLHLRGPLEVSSTG